MPSGWPISTPGISKCDPNELSTGIRGSSGGEYSGRSARATRLVSRSTKSDVYLSHPT